MEGNPINLFLSPLQIVHFADVEEACAGISGFLLDLLFS